MSIKQKTIRGVAWNSVGNVSTQVLRVITIVVMARLLSPDDYGVFGILTVFVGFFAIFANMGVSQAVIWLDNPSHRMLSTIFYLNLAVGVILYGLLYLLADPIAVFFENNALSGYLRIIAATFVIGALNVVQMALLQKELCFKEVIVYDLVSQAFGSVAGIMAAFAGWGVMSLIVLTLSTAAVKTMIYWYRSGWRPGLTFSFDNLRVIWAYCANLTGFSFINYFSRNADNFLIGKFIDSSALGVYSMAYNIMLYPLQNISRVIVRVLFPALSTMKYDDARLKRAYLKVMSFIAVLSFPIMAGLTVVADNFVTVVLGDKWTELSPLLVVLAPVGLMQSIVTTVGSIYMVKGTTGLMLRIGSLNAVVTVISFGIGLPFGVKGVAIAYALANLIMLYPNLKYSWNQVGLSVSEGLSSLKVFFLSAIFMALVVHLAGVLLDNQGWSPISTLFLQMVVGALNYLVSLLLLTRLQILEMVKEILSVRHAHRIVL